MILMLLFFVVMVEENGKVGIFSTFVGYCYFSSLNLFILLSFYIYCRMVVVLDKLVPCVPPGISTVLAQPAASVSFRGG